MASVLGNDFVVVEHSKLLRGIAAHEVEESVSATRVLVKPVSDVEDNTLDDDPEVVLLVVLGDFFHGKFLLGDLELGDVAGLGLLRGRGTGGSGLGGSSRGNLASAGAGASTAPLHGDLAGRGRVDVQGDLAQTLSGTTAAGDELLEEVTGGAVTGDTAIDDATQEGGTTETVGTVNTTRQLPAGVESFEGFLLGVENLGVLVDLNTTHGEVENRLHDGDVEGVVDVEGHVVEEALVPGILLLALGDRIVFAEGLLQSSLAAANLLGQFLTAHLLHEATASVVAGVEVQDIGGLAVEDQTDRPLALLLLLPHLGGDVITVAEFVGETLTIGVKEETTLTTQGWKRGLAMGV